MLTTKVFCYEDVRNYEKILFIQNIVEMAGGGMHTHISPPRFAPGCIITKNGLEFERDVLN